MFNNENVIDSLVKDNASLEVLKQKLEDKKNEVNSKLEAKSNLLDAKAQALRDKAFRNNELYKNKVAEIDRIIEKNTKLMKLESDYYKKLITPNPPLKAVGELDPRCAEKKRR